MAFKTDVANQALGFLAVSLTISDVDTDNSNQAKIVRRNIQESLSEFLEMHPWAFATQYQALNLVESAPSSGYLYAYSTPADCLVVRQIAQEKMFSRKELYEDQKLRWQELFSPSGVRIHSDVPEAWVEYTTNISIDFNFPTYFAKGWAAHLAMRIAPQLITNNYAKIKSQVASDLQTIMTSAIADDMGRQPRKLEEVNPFIAARYRG